MTKNEFTKESLLELVNTVKIAEGDERVRAIVGRITADLFKTIDEFKVTPDEFWAACDWISRLGALGQTQALPYGEPLTVKDVTVTLVPAGHILGSAQVVIDYNGQRAVISGDYKRHSDPTCDPFELMPCDLFVTEATFGLPVYRHEPDTAEVQKLLASLRDFPERTHQIGVYGLGKCQRLIAHLDRGVAGEVQQRRTGDILSQQTQHGGARGLRAGRIALGVRRGGEGEQRQHFRMMRPDGAGPLQLRHRLGATPEQAE